jgi:excisionase family DNA binding protein
MERLAYSVKEAAGAIGVSPRTIVREIQRGRLRAARVSRRVVIPADALAEFLGCHTAPEATAERAVQQASGAR